MNWFHRSASWPLRRQLTVAAGVVALGAVAIGAAVGATRTPTATTTALPVAAGIPPVSVTTGSDDVRSATTAATTTEAGGPAAETAGAPTTGPAPTTPGSSPADRPYGLASAPGDLLAREVLDTIPILLERPAGYRRDLFPTWARTAEPGCDVRDAVLIAESATPVERRPPCTILAGTWISAYDGATLTSPTAVEIDHVVALKEAWDSGAWAWPAERRAAYANDLTDLRTLIAVSGSSNSSKSDKDPSNWLPRSEDTCRFLGDWVAVKARWGLAMDESEWGRVKNLLEGPCAGTRLAPWAPAR